METVDKRPFGFWTATALVVGGVIGAGIYLVPSKMAGFGWTGVVAWIAGAVGALVIGRVLSALTAAKPQEPGLVPLIGDVLGPVAGVLLGWVVWVSYWTANAYIALVAARYAGEIVPALSATPMRQGVTASLVVIALTALNLTGLKSTGRFQVVTTVLKLLPLAAVMLILAGMALSPAPAGTAPVAHPAFSMGALLPAAAMAMLAIIGFESASVAAERIRDPERNVPRATMLGIMLSCAIYLVVSTGIAFTVPGPQLAASNAPIALFVGQHWGGWAAQAVALFAVISTVGCLNVWVLLQGEVPLGMVRAGQLPEWFGRTNSKDIAVVPLMLGSGLSCLMLIAGGFDGGEVVVDFLLNLTAVSGVWIYAFAGAAALKLRLKPVLALLSVLFSVGIMLGGGVYVTLLSIALMATALPLYWLTLRARAGVAA